MLFLLLLAGGYSVALTIMGRRGYGEAASVYTLSYARPLGSRRYDVTQWISAFVTKGDYYTFTHSAAHNLYSTCQDVEAVKALIQNGRDGKFLVDMPLYSKRSFLHRGTMHGHDCSLRIIECDAADTLKKLTLAASPGFPRQTRGIYALYRDAFYTLTIKGERIRMTNQPPQERATFLSEQGINLRGLQQHRFRYRVGRTSQRDPDGLFVNQLLRPLIARCLGGTEGFLYRVETPRTLDDDARIQLFVFARSPDAFRVQPEDLCEEMGYTLYHMDLFPEPAKD